jgi:hypothetical protein
MSNVIQRAREQEIIDKLPLAPQTVAVELLGRMFAGLLPKKALATSPSRRSKCRE